MGVKEIGMLASFIARMVLVLFVLACPAWVAAQPLGTVLGCPGPGELTAVGGQTGTSPTDSHNWVDLGRKLHSVKFLIDLTDTITVELQSSIDGGTVFETVNNSSTSADETFTVDEPVGIFKAVGTSGTGTWVITYHCGAGVGGKP
jgi:hypothetical protein